MTVLIDLVYIIFLVLFFPVLFPFLFCKGLLKKALIRSWFALCKYPELNKPILFHVVSFGEFRNITYLVDGTSRNVIVLTPDPSLHRHLKKNWESEKRQVRIAPLDFSFCVKRMISRVKPEKLVFSEVDIWPNLVLCALGSGVSVTWINARLSQANQALFSQFPLYRLFSRKIDIYPKDFVNTRFLKSRHLPCRDWVNFKMLGTVCNSDIKSRTIVVGSCHSEDEEQVFSVLRKLRDLDYRVIFVPRNIERSEQILEKGRRLGFSCTFENDWTCEQDFLVVNRMGVLCSYYREASFAFVGGSFLDLGGHNIIEPALVGCQVFFGPCIRNFQEEAVLLTELGIGFEINSGKELVDLLIKDSFQPRWKELETYLNKNKIRFEKLKERIMESEL